MKLGIMQPYFFPYLGYFDLINQTDSWIVFDCVKYSKRSWMNRNRVLHPKDGWQYVNVPVSGAGTDTQIAEVTLQDKAAARDRTLGQLQHYRQGRAPNYSTVCDLLSDAFARCDDNRLRTLNICSLQVVTEYLSIPFSYKIQSEMNLDLPPIEHAGRWALEICSAVGATEYLNPPGGREIFVTEEWGARGITLNFTELDNYSYKTGPYEFVPHLSILDVLMWSSPAEVKEHLDAKKSDGA